MRPRCGLPRRRRQLEHNQCHGPFNFFPPFCSLSKSNIPARSCRQGCYPLPATRNSPILRVENFMHRLVTIGLALCLGSISALCQENKSAAPGHYLFAWTGDVAHRGNDFLAVIDADPSSPSYGRLVTTLATDQPTKLVHHTEYVMPSSGMLFANDHDAGRTFIFDLRDALHPKTVTSFTDMAGYMHPHSFLRLPNGHVLATFQHVHSGEGDGQMGGSGGLVEIDDQGTVVRSA